MPVDKRSGTSAANGRKGGRPPGALNKKTLDKIAAREAVRQRITERIVPLVDAQIDSAIGIKHFFLRDEATGQWKRIKNPEQIAAALNKATDKYWIYTKDPNSLAAREMLDRAIDKPKEQLQEIKLEGGDELIQALYAGRERAAKRGKK